MTRERDRYRCALQVRLGTKFLPNGSATEGTESTGRAAVRSCPEVMPGGEELLHLDNLRLLHGTSVLLFWS